MKKFFYAAVAALALCGADAHAAHVQAGGVRVGPAADDVAAEAPAQPKPKKVEKGSASDAKKDAKSPSSEKAREPAKGQEPAPLSNTTASTVAPTLKSNPSSTTDAPSKSVNEPGVPVGATVKTSTGAEGANDTGKGTSPANNGQPTTEPNNPAASPTAPRPSNASAAPANASPVAAVSPASIYRIGTGDVLDIRLLNGQDPRQNTLYTVVAGGVLDYPLLKDPLTVSGMTTEELSAQLVAEFRHRNLYEKPQVRVSVREYASHAVLVSGLVGDPGTKILRREAIPLYVVIAESQPKPEAGRAVIVSQTAGKVVNVDLNDASGLNTLVMSGDVITLTVRPPEFYYVGGEVGAPGQKDFHSGITLTQALLASGGVTKTAGERVRVLRANPDGRLSPTEFNLREIENGAVPDPLLQPGDRIEVQAPPVKRK
ncbi:MAG: polysaccharide biosynthesis/export protein [Acidobacteriota bacterium]|jgi:protein involved in polysaccharide export with SLBB domain|nr:polysaccharide biosynthesis/export protein [Acidobacteriota bacterium]